MSKSPSIAAPAAPAFDIVVCTRNRLPLLKETVAALLDAARGHPATRILIVDNGSTDGTGAYIGELAAADPRIVSLSEPQPGVYHARARAIRAVRGDIFVFVDDDVIPQGDFLNSIATAFADPTVGAVGGQIDGLFDAPLPDWFSSRFLPWLPIQRIDGPVQDCAYPYLPPGACLALRNDPCREYFSAPQRRQAELGYGGGAISGQPATGGDDLDLCEIYLRAGFRVIRTPTIRVGHRVHMARLTPEWIVGRFRMEGHTRVRMARLRGKPAIGGETVRMLGSFPILALFAMVAGGLAPKHRLLIRAYFAKSRAAWAEVLFGRRDLRLPYPPEPLA